MDADEENYGENLIQFYFSIIYFILFFYCISASVSPTPSSNNVSLDLFSSVVKDSVASFVKDSVESVHAVKELDPDEKTPY